MSVLCTLVSGSSGNAALLSHKGVNILIDCGISGKQAALCLCDIGKSPDMIHYILVTHEHTDHTKGVGVLSRRFNIPIIASQGTWRGMDIGKIPSENKIAFERNDEFILGDIAVTPFNIPHDAMQPTGYCFDLGNKKIAVATDIGHINKEVKSAVTGCEVVILESNYDSYMLENGPYPQYLKQRIRSSHGHLCNDDAGDFAAYLVKTGTKNIILGHLSKENNSETTAKKTVMRAMSRYGIKIGLDVCLDVAPRYNAGSVIGL
ncbi:MAG: MBL fold metallo-hydrolase [Firmicutes bacterium]|nr:MBL fold metallo-hydrolase [Bacillota bacterium]